MQKLSVGLRRVYLAPLCAVPNDQSVNVSVRLEQTDVSICIGKQPRFNLTVTEGLKLPFTTEVPTPITFKAGVPASETAFSGFAFTEIVCTHDIDVEDTEYDLLKSRDQVAMERAIKHAQDRELKMELSVDAIVAAIGLRLHVQFVKHLVTSELVACVDQTCLARSFAGHGIEVLPALTTNERTAEGIRSAITGLAALGNKDRAKAIDAAYWVTRAWSETSGPGQLVELFVVMEMLLEGIGRAQASASPSAELLREFVRASGPSNESELLAAIDKLDQGTRPSLPQRFEVLAEKSATKMKDVEAFRKFNGFRNGLVHRGEPSAIVHLMKDGSVADLEDLVERYLSQSIWGDMSVYPSFHRTQRTRETEPDRNPEV